MIHFRIEVADAAAHQFKVTLTVADPAYVTIGWTVANLGTAVASGPWVLISTEN